MVDVAAIALDLKGQRHVESAVSYGARHNQRFSGELDHALGPRKSN